MKADWKPISEAPPWKPLEQSLRDALLVFKGYSKSGAFSEPVIVSGWVNKEGHINHNYRYKLVITHFDYIYDQPAHEDTHE